MSGGSKGGRAMDFDNMGSFLLAVLGIVIGTSDTTGGYTVLGGCGALLEGTGLASALDEGT